MNPLLGDSGTMEIVLIGLAIALLTALVFLAWRLKILSTAEPVRKKQVLHGLPQGLTETAIEAVKKIKFRAAVRNGAPVNVRMQLGYNFNLL